MGAGARNEGDSAAFRLAVAATLGLAVLVAASKPSAGSTAPPLDSSAAQEGPAPFAALVDDTGAVVLRASGSGTVEAIGIRRDGTRKPWKLILEAGELPLGCVTCPDVLVADAKGALSVVRDAVREPVQISEPLSLAAGAPGAAFVPDATVLATDSPSGALRLRLLGSAGLSADDLETAPVATLPLTTYQQRYSAMAVTTGGRAVAISRVSALRAGELRLVQVDGPDVAADAVEPAWVSDLESVTEAAACISDDGSDVAFVIPGQLGAKVLRGGFGGKLRSVSVPDLRRPSGCIVSNGKFATVWSEGGPESPLSHVTRLSASGAVSTTKLPEGIVATEFCTRTGALLAQSEAGAQLLPVSGASIDLPEARISGCTPAGTAWFVRGNGVSWVKSVN